MVNNQGIMHAARQKGGEPLCKNRNAHMSTDLASFENETIKCKRCAAKLQRNRNGLTNTAGFTHANGRITMRKCEEMMVLPAEKRREYFRKVYTLELGKAHAKSDYAWPIERLPNIVKQVMENLSKRNVPRGRALDETKKFFGLKTQKTIFEFLEY